MALRGRPAGRLPGGVVRPRVDAAPGAGEAGGDDAVRALLATVGPGGLLLAVYHDLDDHHREHLAAQGLDPADFVGADDPELLLGDDFIVELRAVEPRLDPPPGTPARRRHRADIVLRARRR